MESDRLFLTKGYVLKGKKNRYIIDSVLGQGAFGITYLARYKASIQGDIGSGSVWAQVAIKEFFMRDLNVRDGSTGYLNDSSQDSVIGRYRRAFMREARNLAGLQHDNIVNVFEVIETNNTVYIVMEYINGGSLDERIAQVGHLSQDESIDKMLQLCSAVECMHENRMLHLDIKPKNVMLDEDDNLYLIDFGLSKQYTADGEPESSTSIGLGTPGYAPSEQAVHQDGDNKFRVTLDIYALGATMYKMLTGNTPPNATDVSDSVLDGDNIIPKLLKDAGVTEKLAEVVAKAMFPSSSKRFQRVGELMKDLENIELKNASSSQDTNENETEETLVTSIRSDLASDSVSESKNTSTHFEPIGQPDTVESCKPDTKANNEYDSASKSNAGKPKRVYRIWLFFAIAIIGIIVYLGKSYVKPVSTAHLDNSKDTDSIYYISVTSIDLSDTTLIIEVGDTFKIAAIISPTEATDKNIIWESINPEIVTVDSLGNLKAEKVGSTRIRVSNGYIESYCDITVKKKSIKLKSLYISPNYRLTLVDGATLVLKVHYAPENATDKNTIWISSDTKVATVNNNGTITAIKPGKTKISATSGGVSDYIDLTVTNLEPTEYLNNYGYVDLGLSVKWATCNIGSSVPEGYGDYFAWGETNTKTSYTWANYKFREEGDKYDNLKFSKYNYFSNDFGPVDNKTGLDLSDDVANIKLGRGWRMPSRNELNELEKECEWTLITLNGIDGFLVTSRKSGYLGRSIFIPCAGSLSESNVIDRGKRVTFWTRNIFQWRGPTCGTCVEKEEGLTSYMEERYVGLPVRPVCP